MKRFPFSIGSLVIVALLAILGILAFTGSPTTSGSAAKLLKNTGAVVIGSIVLIMFLGNRLRNR